ncbi:MAG: hypothetical protein H7833_01000 [Magnetococcus sp. DMHC-1]
MPESVEGEGEGEEEEEEWALLHFAESSLSQEWERPEEDEAWAHLQPGGWSRFCGVHRDP